MANPTLDEALRREYQELFDSCSIVPSKVDVVRSVVQKIDGYVSNYMSVANQVGMPWWIVGIIHMMESSCNFRTHLHNGDPLTARTVRAPKGRPVSGSPPFSWEESAIDAMLYKGFDKVGTWDIPTMLYLLEAYNGFGYRVYHPDVLSPYLWSMSQHYQAGKYVSDGTWSQTAISQQCGAAVIMKRMFDEGIACLSCFLNDTEVSDASDTTLVSRYTTTMPLWAEVEKTKHLQRWLNTFDGIAVIVDGWAGNNTSEAYRRVTGHYLPGDPREA